MEDTEGMDWRQVWECLRDTHGLFLVSCCSPSFLLLGRDGGRAEHPETKCTNWSPNVRRRNLHLCTDLGGDWQFMASVDKGSACAVNCPNYSRHPKRQGYSSILGRLRYI